MVEKLGVVCIGQESSVCEETGEVVDEYQEEDWAKDWPLGYPVGQWKGIGGAASHSLFSVDQIALEPFGRPAVPLEFVQEDAVIDTVKGFAQVKRR